MATMCPALRCRIGAQVCAGAFLVLNVFFLAGFNPHDRPNALGICMLDAILLLAGMLLYRRSRRLTPASPLSKHYQIDRTG